MQLEWQKGITFLETMIVSVVVMLIAGFGVVNLLGAQQKTSAASQVETIITDVKNQQIKAMTGDTEGRNSRDYYGVHFTPSSYILFHGTTYNSSDTSNFTIPIDGAYTFTNITFTNGNLIFIPVNGEVYGYSSLTNSIKLQNKVAKTTTQLQFNYLGVLTEIQ